MASRKKNKVPKRLFGREKGIMVPPRVEMIHDMPGQLKMSEVLEEFTEPFRRSIDTPDQLDNLFNLATFAWNCAMLPEDQRGAQINKIIIEGFPKATQEDRTDIQAFLQAMIQHKLDHFASIQRMVRSVNLTHRGREFHIMVASTPDITRMPGEFRSDNQGHSEQSAMGLPA